MIAQIEGRLIEKRSQSILLETNGLTYEIFLPVIGLAGICDDHSSNQPLRLVTYHYHHLEPSRSTPVLIGFLNEIEKEFFEIFITVSGIGPRAALRAINVPISRIAQAIDESDADFLRSLPGIGAQRAKEIIAKLQGKIGRFGLIQDKSGLGAEAETDKGLLEEVIEVLLQLQYKRSEAKEMALAAIKTNAQAKSVEEILNTVYKQRSKK